MSHSSTIQQRVEWVCQMMAPTMPHGYVSGVSGSYGVSRQTLYRWKEKGSQGLQAALESKSSVGKTLKPIAEHVLTLLIEGHGSYRDIQTCLQKLCGIQISLGSIVRVVKEAGERAQRWLQEQGSESARALALDEQYSSQRGKAYLNVIDVHSGQVWATHPPVAVDGEAWTLAWWMLQEQGVRCSCSVSDGGHAIHDALKQVEQLESHQRDIWHILHLASQVQGRCDRAYQIAQDRLPVIQRQVARLAQGKKALGRAPEVDEEEHHKRIRQARSVSEALAYLSGQLHHLLEVVVVPADPTGEVLSSQRRCEELEVLLTLLQELSTQASPAVQKELVSLGKQVRLALPHVLLFAETLEQPQQHACQQLGSQAVRLLAWAWQRRAVLGPTVQELLEGFDPAWREEAQALLSAWEHTVRASSAVENWHSILRPHLAVHRTLSAGMLALLAVWHNHQIAPRGLHEGLSPLQRTGDHLPETSWLAALGYSCLAA